MSYEDKVERLLKEHGMVWVRGKKHNVYRHPDGRSFAVSSSPSDNHAANQQLRSLRKFLGLGKPVIPKNPDRSEKKTNHEAKAHIRFEPCIPMEDRTLRSQLATINVRPPAPPPPSPPKPVVKPKPTVAPVLLPPMEKSRHHSNAMRLAFKKAGLL